MSTAALSPMALLGGTGMVLIALGFFVYAVLRRLGWGYLLLGALAWVVTVAVKFAWAVPINPRLYAFLNSSLPGGIGGGLFDLYVGFLTGITEVTIVWLVMRYTRLGQVRWERALAFGIGFGAIEALLLGLGSLISAAVGVFAPQMIPAETMKQLLVMNNLAYEIAPIVERFFTVWVHIFCNVLIFFAVAKMQARWFWLSFWFKSLIDAVAAYAQTSGIIASAEGIWAIEAIVVVFGVVGWLGVRWLKSRYDAASELQGARRVAASELFTTFLLVIAFIVLTASAVFAIIPQGKALTDSEEQAVLAYAEPKTTNLLTAINNNDYATFSRDLNDKMKAAIPESGLVNMRTKVNDKIGNYVSRQVDSVSQSGDFVTIIYKAQFEKEDGVTVRVVFDATEPHRISGLWFDSPKLRQQ